MNPTGYIFTSADGVGGSLTLTKELFEAFEFFIRTKATGSVIVDFKNGGIAGVESSVKKVYK